MSNGKSNTLEGRFAEIRNRFASTKIGLTPQPITPPNNVEKGSEIVRALSKIGSNLGVRLDTWVNNITGFGTDRDKTTYGTILPNRILSDQEVSALYHGDDMAARMVDVVPQEMFREGFTIETGDSDIDTIVADKYESLDVRGKFADGVRWGRCYGGSALIIGADDRRPANLPLIPERADDIRYLYVIDRRYLWPASYYTEPGHPKLGEPQTYLVTTMGAANYSVNEVHESRLILFRGATTGIRERVDLSSWDMSVLQRAYDVLRQFNTGWKAVETMMTDGNQGIFKMSGLTQILASPGGGGELLQRRLQIMDLYRSVIRAIVVDADSKEEFTRQSVSFSEIPQTLEKFMLRLAATAEIPVTILMGQSPAGMNATGESDFRWFYDRIRAKQTTDITPRLRMLTSIWLKTKAGTKFLRAKEVKTINVKYPALWTETPLAQAQREAAIATRDSTYIQAQVLDPDEVAIQRFRPEGFQSEIVLTPEAMAARTASFERTIAAIAKDPGEGSQVESTLPLAPTDLAAVVTANEARASINLPNFQGGDGNLTIPEYKARHAQAIAAAAAADQGTTQSSGPIAPPKVASPNEPTNEPSDEEVANAMPFDLHTDAKPRTFILRRDEDESGVSGTGDVAEGVLFGDGRVALRWKTETASTTLFDDMKHVLRVHGHGGKTRVVWDDE